MRYRIRVPLPTGAPAIVKHDANDPFDALAYAGRVLAQAGHSLSLMKSVKLSVMKESKQSTVYVGAVPKPRPKRRVAGDKAAAVETANNPGSSDAVVAAGKAEKAGKSAKKK